MERTEVEEEDGMTLPERLPVDSVHGTTIVVTTLIVVTGMVVCTVPAEVDVLENVEAQVTIAGLELT